jgi:hypothetical protein
MATAGGCFAVYLGSGKDGLMSTGKQGAGKSPPGNKTELSIEFDSKDATGEYALSLVRSLLGAKEALRKCSDLIVTCEPTLVGCSPVGPCAASFEVTEPCSPLIIQPK